MHPLRRMPTGDDTRPYGFSEDEDDLWPVQAPRAQALLAKPPIEQTIVSVTGRMALMRTVPPEVFVDIKRWLSRQGSRPVGKRRRDRRQAGIVQQLLDEQLLVLGGG